MAGEETDAGDSYSVLVGLIYIFNLIVGTGALTMPHAFSNAGWLLSLLIVVALGFMSYLTATFVIEAMAVANALVHWRTVQHLKRVINEDEATSSITSPDVLEDLIKDEVISSSIGETEKMPLLLSNSMESLTDSSKSSVDYFSITERIEMGKMAGLFFSKMGVNVFYLCIAIYLYGDLAIYGAAVSKSLRDVACTYGEISDPNGTVIDVNGTSHTNNASVLTSHSPCWGPDIGLSRGNAYRVFLTIFLFLLGPFAFFNVQKTKYLQLMTTVLRWLAFLSMIVLTARRLIRGEGTGHPPVADVGSVPNLFGVCVYSFMCHHSLPSLVTPVKQKDRLFTLLASDYFLILCFYSLLSFMGIFAFNHIDDIFTLNFQPDRGGTGLDILISVPFLEYFLALFPVFTLSTNFPIIAITLRNNLKTLFLKENQSYPFLVEQILFPLVTILPPIAIAFATESLDFLVGITGSYAGVAIQYIVPALLVYYARKDCLTALGLGVKNNHTSPFKHRGWIFFVLLWAGASVIFVTVYHIVEGK